MFNLSFDDEESDSGITFDLTQDLNIKKGFFDKLPKEFEKIVGQIKSKIKGDCPKLKSGTSGAFGQVEITNSKVKKLLNLIQSDKHNILLTSHIKGSKTSDLYFLLNRLNNYCKDIKDYIKLSKKYFPNNFIKVFKCKKCNFGGKQVPYVYVEMETGKGSTMKEFLDNPKILKKDIASVIIQIYYISLVLNMKKLYHNDLKPANIIISKSTKKIKYDSLKNSKGDKITMILPKGQYYPILIDYDLVTKGKARPASGIFVSEEGSADYDFLTETTKKIMPKTKIIFQDLPDFDKLKNIKKSLGSIYQGVQKQNKVMKVSFNGEQIGGNPLLARAGLMIAKNPTLRNMAMNIVKNPVVQQQAVQSFIPQGQPQQMPMRIQMPMRMPQQMQQQLNQRFQQMQQQPQFQQMMPQQYRGGAKKKRKSKSRKD